LRVGQIKEIWVHPEAEKLYCEKIDIGNGEERGVVSGLRDYIPIEEMKDRKCIVICNLPGRTMKGFESNGMLLAAEHGEGDAKKIEILTPPEGSVPGDLVEFVGEGRNPPALLPKKKNAWERVQPDLNVGSDGKAQWKAVPLAVAGKGNVTVPTLKEGMIK